MLWVIVAFGRENRRDSRCLIRLQTSQRGPRKRWKADWLAMVICFKGSSVAQSCPIQQNQIAIILFNFQKDQGKMAQLRKTVRTARTRQDYELFKVSLPSYDPQLAPIIQLHLAPGDFLKPAQPFATLYTRPNENSQPLQEHPLTTHITGTVDRIGAAFEDTPDGWRIRKGAKRGTLEIMQVRACQHIIEKQSIKNSDITGNSNLPPLEVCPKCGKEIWVYLQSQQVPITPQNLMAANDGLQFEALFELEWSIILNEQFTPTTTIAKARDRQIYYPALAKASYLIGEGQKPKLSVPLMKIRRVICRHQKLYGNRCQFCLKVIDHEQIQQFTRYLFQLGPNGSWKSCTKGAALVQQEEQYIASLVAKNRAILILDLDNTILHSTEMSQLDLSKLLLLKQYFLLPKLDQTTEGKVRQDFIVVKMRPYIKEFLYTISKLFEVYIYTKGTRIYADEICRWVRAQWAGDPQPYEFTTWSDPPQKFLKHTQCFVPFRVVSRNEDANLDTKSMQNILPTRTQYHLILDDRRDVWANSPSWFYTRDYFYFFKKPKNNMISSDIGQFLSNKQEESSPIASKLADCYNRMRQDYPERCDYKIETTDRPDYFLLYASHTLRKIHSYFFDHLKKHHQDRQSKSSSEHTSKEKDEKKPHGVSIANLMQRLKLFLSKKKLRFFLAPGDEGVSTIRRALKMGACVLKQNSLDTPDYVIRGNSFIKFIQKYREGVQNKGQNQAIASINQQRALGFTQSLENYNGEKLQEKGINQEVRHEQKIYVEGSNLNDSKQVLQPAATIESQANKQAPKKEQKKIDYEAEMKYFQSLVKKDIPIISETWILACYQFSYKFKSEDFKLGNPFKEQVDHGDFNEPIARGAEKIKKEIAEQMAKQI